VGGGPDGTAGSGWIGSSRRAGLGLGLVPSDLSWGTGTFGIGPVGFGRSVGGGPLGFGSQVGIGPFGGGRSVGGGPEGTAGSWWSESSRRAGLGFGLVPSDLSWGT
jgi:hypothetical protein